MRRKGRKEPRDFFSPTELKVLELGLLSLRNSAFTLSKAQKTISRHRTNVIGKLEALTQQEISSFQQATEIALRLGVITVSEVISAYGDFLGDITSYE